MTSGLDAAARIALDLVRPGDRVGLGTGRAAARFVEHLALRPDLRVTVVATSDQTADQARGLGLTVVDLGQDELALTVDGADEVSRALDLVKGWGGALVRERIVAAASRRQVIVVGPEKQVQRLGERGRIPIEVIPMALGFVGRRIRELGHAEARALEAALLAIPGVVDTGLFLGTADRVLIGLDGGEVRVLRRG
jgi:ribose 5-phosphate isomerase A